MKYIKIAALTCALFALFACQNPTTPTNANNPDNATGTPTKPVFNYSAGSYWGGIELTITATNAKTIRYTTDGTDPKTSATYSLFGTTPITVSSSKTIKAVAVNADDVMSEVMSADYVIDTDAAWPTISMDSGSFNTAQTVTVTSDANTVVRYTYTTNNTPPPDPSETDPICPSTLTLESKSLSEIYYTYKFKAFTTANDPSVPRGATVSDVMTRTWKIDTLPPSAPTGLKAKCEAGGAVSLQWTAFDTANTDVRTYSVHYGVGSQASDATNQWGTPISSAFSTPSGLTVNTRYSFVVNAIDEAGNVSSPGAFVSWFALDDYKNWGTLAPISLQTNSVVDALTTFTKMDGYLVANLAGKGVDLLTLSDPSSIHRVKRIRTKHYSDTANKGTAYYGLSSKASPYQIDIIDMSTPKSPIVLGTLPAEEYARFAVSSDGAYLLVALPTTKAVRIYDLSVPTAPTLSATFAINESINVNLLSVSLKDGYLVLDCREQGVHFYEFTSPTEISFVGTADYGASSQGAYIGHKGKYAIFGKTSDSSMTVRDVTNIGTVVKSIAANPSAAFTPCMMGDCLYAEDSSSYMNVSADLYRWDLSALPTINAPTVSVDAVPARVGLGRWSRVSATEYMVWDSGKGIGCLFDVSNPTAPVFGTPFTFSYESSYSYVDATSALFFAIDSYSDLSVIRQDLTDPSASEVTYFKKFSGGVMSGIPPTQQYSAVKAGSTYWLVNGSKLVGVTESAGEFSLASAPASMLSLPNMSSGSGDEIGASGNVLFVRAFNAIHVVDVSTSSVPSRTATIAGPFSNSTAFQHGCFVAADGKLYVSSGFKLVVYDVSAPLAPVVLGSLDYGVKGYPEDSNYPYSQDIIIQGGKAYIEVGGSSGVCKLLVVDVSVPASPVILGVSAEYSLGSTATWEADRLRVDGNYCFAYNRDMKFAVIDVQDPAAPNVLSARSLGSGSGNGYETMYVSGDKFIAADRFMDIQYVSD